MKIALIGLPIALLAACSQQQTDDAYWCSYETDPAQYQHCMEVGKDLDDTTARSAGKQVTPKQ
ncbi:hypothetical protein KO507_00930 [Gilvimarinus agarilyticus]|uniref:hypothetical protein n=1 Tax=unclassified Gilvimarinus TaxID=2642066 RepID=UPI001C0979A9|nr:MULTISPECIES: hypothetical protein [unclassified Gilvimarinus]MBU2884321.1 hypothetical protein [Gilvimarinus agarilyticus]MDO6569460.1 hypothetical protein [Gilvimarinus sp. 2_MG-2023]MDO6747617.1 hypothetical protein [Gilvimarinus sp. 1_MG-2023]